LKPLAKKVVFSISRGKNNFHHLCPLEKNFWEIPCCPPTGKNPSDAHVCRGRQGEIERIHSPPTSSKNRFKSFCELGYANFRPNFFATGKRISK